MAPLVKRLLYQHEGLGSIPRTDIKKIRQQGLDMCAYNPSAGDVETGRSLRPTGYPA